MEVTSISNNQIVLKVLFVNSVSFWATTSDIDIALLAKRVCNMKLEIWSWRCTAKFVYSFVFAIKVLTQKLRKPSYVQSIRTMSFTFKINRFKVSIRCVLIYFGNLLFTRVMNWTSKALISVRLSSEYSLMDLLVIFCSSLWWLL